MKYLLILFLFINLKTYSQADDKLKNEAMQFSLEVIKTFFRKDGLNSYLEKVSDTVFSLRGKTIFLKKDDRRKISESFKEAVRDKSKTFQDYQTYYKYEVLPIQEFIETYNLELPKNFKTTETDFYFMGLLLKDSKKNATNFIWGDCFNFMVRKVNGKWCLQAIAD